MSGDREESGDGKAAGGMWRREYRMLCRRSTAIILNVSINVDDVIVGDHAYLHRLAPTACHLCTCGEATCDL